MDSRGAATKVIMWQSRCEPDEKGNDNMLAVDTISSYSIKRSQFVFGLLTDAINVGE